MKTEAERRLDAFNRCTETTFGERVSDAKRAETLALLRAIFEPLPPEPEPVETLGQVLWEAGPGRMPWDTLSAQARGVLDHDAQTVIAAHEARRPKPTVGEVARVMLESPPTKVFGEALWERSSPDTREYWIEVARSVFPLFGVEP